MSCYHSPSSLSIRSCSSPVAMNEWNYALIWFILDMWQNMATNRFALHHSWCSSGRLHCSAASFERTRPSEKRSGGSTKQLPSLAIKAHGPLGEKKARLYYGVATSWDIDGQEDALFGTGVEITVLNQLKVRCDLCLLSVTLGYIYVLSNRSV